MADGSAPPAVRVRPSDPPDPHRDLLGRLWDAVDLWRYRRKVGYWKRSGVRFGRGVLVMPSAELDTTYGWMIAVGDRSRIGHRVRILTHDASAQRDLHHGRVGPVTIGEDCLIAEGAIILPGVTIGDRVMLGAGSVAVADIASNSRAMGVPARVYGTFDDYLEETRRAIAGGPRFAYGELHDLPPELRERTLAALRASGERGYSHDPFSVSPYYVTPPDGDGTG